MNATLPPEVLDLMDATPAQRRSALFDGHVIDTATLKNTAYLGVSIGLPAWVDRLAWKTFVKVFVSDDPDTDSIRGWNMRMVQNGIDGPHEAQLDRDEQKKVFGYFQVRNMPAKKLPQLNRGHALLDYGVAPNSVFDPLRLVRDPLVALRSGSTELLWGRTYLTLAGCWIPTPCWFALVRQPSLQCLVDTAG
jgi:hypothetical protein